MLSRRSMELAITITFVRCGPRKRPISTPAVWARGMAVDANIMIALGIRQIGHQCDDRNPAAAQGPHRIAHHRRFGCHKGHPREITLRQFVQHRGQCVHVFGRE